MNLHNELQELQDFLRAALLDPANPQQLAISGSDEALTPATAYHRRDRLVTTLTAVPVTRRYASGAVRPPAGGVRCGHL